MSAWLSLFARAGRTTQLVVCAHMDACIVQRVLVWHQPDQELRDHIVATYGRAILAGIASRWNASCEVIEELITYEEPERNTALFLHTALTDAQRRHVLAGRLWHRGADAPAGQRLPLAPALVEGVGDNSGRRG